MFSLYMNKGKTEGITMTIYCPCIRDGLISQSEIVKIKIRLIWVNLTFFTYIIWVISHHFNKIICIIYVFLYFSRLPQCIQNYRRSRIEKQQELTLAVLSDQFITKLFPTFPFPISSPSELFSASHHFINWGVLIRLPQISSAGSGICDS